MIDLRSNTVTKSSFVGQRWQNPESALAYVESGPRREDVTEANPTAERFFVGLRRSEGITPEPAEWAHWGEPIARFLADRLTPRGVMLSNDILQEFL